MNANHQTLAGIVPVENHEAHFVENTLKAEAYLQKKIDVVIMATNKAYETWNNDHPDSEPKKLIDPIEIELLSTQFSSKFCPFILILPESVLQGRNRGKGKGNELDIFNPQHTERSAIIKKEIYDIILPFMYDDADRNAFFSSTFQHSLRISSRTAGSLKANSRLKIHAADKGRTLCVAVLLDPIRVFHNMAKPVDNPDAKFEIYIDETKQINSGNFRYHFTRKIKTRNGKRKKNFDIEKQIIQNITGRRQR